MFYSHTILAKKAPLGTVWIAAHLERRLKKSQLDDIDIPTYAVRIMCPEVPIALRLSAHLLLGIVKIYSLKVNYLLQDCNSMRTVIRTVIPTAQIDLPPDADRAPFEFLTKPDNFQLDAFDLEDALSDAVAGDDHMKTYNQITISGQDQDIEDRYVAFHIIEDGSANPSTQKLLLNTEAEPMNLDVMPPFDTEMQDALEDVPARDSGPSTEADGSHQSPREDAAAKGPGTEADGSHQGPREDVAAKFPGPGDESDGSHQGPFRDIAAKDVGPGNDAGGSHQGPNEGRSLPYSPEMGVMRDAVHNIEQINPPESHFTNNENGVDGFSVPTINGKESASPILRLLADQIKEPVSLPVRVDAPSFDSDIPTTEISLGRQPSLNFEIQPSPPAEKRKPKSRKKREFFDESLVLSNADMKKQLEDTSKLICKRRKLPCSALDLWRFQKILKNEGVLHKPLLSGICANLHEVFEREYPTSRIDSAPLEPSLGPMNNELEMLDRNMEIEPPGSMNPDLDKLDRNAEFEPPGPMNPDDRNAEFEQPLFGNTIDYNTPNQMLTPSGRAESLPPHISNRGSSPDTEAFSVPEIPLSFKKHPSAEPFDLEPETPFGLLDSRQYDSAFPEAPSLLNSADIDDFTFLEGSNNTSSGFGESEVDAMSARTRAVAKYFKEISPVTESLENQPGYISLNKILMGKKRKQCAQIFFETLVLKTSGFIDVEQEENYGDVLISKTPALAEAKF